MKNTVIMPPRLTTPVQIGAVPLVYPTRMRSQYIGSPRESIGPEESRDAQPLETFINGIYTEHRDPAPTWIKVIGRKLSNKSRAGVYSCCRMNLTRDAILTKIPNFMNLGLSSVHTLIDLGSVFIPTNIIERPSDG